VKLILVDVDGVLTDGRVTIDALGNEAKGINYRDLDAIAVGRRAGFDFAFVTGEDTEMVRVLAKRFSIQMVYPGAKDKLKAMRQISKEFDIPLNGLLYIGDSDRDAPALEAVGLGVAPNDATASAKTAAHVQTDSKGGCGVLLEVVDKLIAGKWRFPESI
jgi:YrbI family 3-deoxy-D-manno-octulosonate 8-phosphate phosphatase